MARTGVTSPMANQKSKRAIETQFLSTSEDGIVPEDEDTQPLTHHLTLLPPQVPVHLPPQLDDGGQADLVPDVICVSLGRVLLGVTGGWQQDYSSSRDQAQYPGKYLNIIKRGSA